LVDILPIIASVQFAGVIVFHGAEADITGEAIVEVRLPVNAILAE
jgi:hypothetical protein